MSSMQKLKLYFENHGYYLLFVLLCALLFLMDLGNLNAIRQGTEGFYLQISKEMFQQHSWLTPLYKGEPHWSKPPIHFWFAQILYTLFGFSSLALARATTALTAIVGMIYIAHWVKRVFSIPSVLTLLAFASTIGMYKYARIYMMEMPLAMLSTLAALKFYDFINTRKLADFIMASTLLAFATLVKGPVAMVMVLAGSFFYIAYLLFWEKGQSFGHLIRSYILFVLCATALASVWFVACYLHYGMDFINYFFLRENIGKFTAQSYPMSVLFQGLFLYAFPLTLLIPLSGAYFKRHLKDIASHYPSHHDRALIFLSLNFIPFFFLWFIPSQRSHHYALPALPITLILLLVTSYYYQQKYHQRSEWSSRFFSVYCKFLNSFAYFFIATLSTLAVASLLVFFFSQAQASWQLPFIAALLLVNVIAFCFNHSGIGKLAHYTIFFCLIWAAVIPRLSLPDISDEAISLAQGKTVNTTLKKFYFIAEALNQEVKPIEPQLIETALNRGELVISNVDNISAEHEKSVKILASWPVWKRRMHFSAAVRLYRQGGLAALQETRILLAGAQPKE